MTGEPTTTTPEEEASGSFNDEARANLRTGRQNAVAEAEALEERHAVATDERAVRRATEPEDVTNP